MPDLLARLTTFVLQAYFVASQVDNEFNQIVNILNGTSTDKRIYSQFSDGSLPVLRLNQTGAGDIADFQQAGTSKITIKNNGQIVSTCPNGTAPFSFASTTLVTNLNAALLQV